MQSHVCIIEKGSADLATIFRESEKVAEYNGLTHKQALQLRLLCEEVDGMLPNIIDNFCGKLWIECESGVCKVNVTIDIPELNAGRKKELIEISKSKRNAAAVGVVGKIRCAIEDFLLNEENYVRSTSEGAFGRSVGYSEGVDYGYVWSLENYRETISKDDQSAAWDELEKSVIASVADDVIVSVKGNRAEIIIVKKFV